MIPMDPPSVWPEDDSLRLLTFLGLRSVEQLLPSCKALHGRLSEMAKLQRQSESTRDPAATSALLQIQQALAQFQYFGGQALAHGLGEEPMQWTDACSKL